MTNKNQHLEQHLNEFKNRLLICLLFFAVTFFTCFYFKENLFDLVAQPLQQIMPLQSTFIATHISENFLVYLKICLWASLFINLPFMLFQLYLFIAPALYKNEKVFILTISLFSTILFYGSAIIVYNYMLPIIYKFFLSFDQTILQAKISEYFTFSLHLVFAFALTFQLPTVLIVLIKSGLVKLQTLTSVRKYFIVFIAIFAALITPPDVISQLFIIVPLVIFYEATILLLKLTNNSKLK